jgi:hypothetical protein
MLVMPCPVISKIVAQGGQGGKEKIYAEFME